MSRKQRDSDVYKLSQVELKRLNAELKPKGAKLCNTCGGQFPLTDEHWYFSAKGRDRTTLYSSAACRKCSSARVSAKGRKRYKKDKAYREYKNEYRRQYLADEDNAEHHRNRNREKIAEKRLEAKRQAFEQRISGYSEES